ncbi:hypothetical protein NC653_030100 [Populus alba x Populus x berolinensis]|uniref:Uncharacterized protein n=1 Tax=Populus alba x Populus x berolinensis TaxID=444605 RepID=A0AAD6LVK8_9ROSI|nr:hypothetical protein NC653_030100 [Populus alba x Populus x berolinensis]
MVLQIPHLIWWLGHHRMLKELQKRRNRFMLSPYLPALSIDDYVWKWSWETKSCKRWCYGISAVTIVHWAPQEKVFAHPSVECLLNSLWFGNSNLEGISMGVPLLCWPHMGRINSMSRTCICDRWKVGLELKPDEDGIFTRHEIKSKVDELLINVGIRENALKIKRLAQMSLSEGGSSSKNLEQFVGRTCALTIRFLPLCF